MRVKWRTVILLLLVLSFSFGMLVACSSGEESEGPSADSTPGSSSDDEGDEESTVEEEVMLDHKFDPPVTITTVQEHNPNASYRDGEDNEDNVHTRWAEEELGINIDTLWTVQGNENYLTRLRLALSANEPLPDVVTVNDMNLARELIRAGLVQPVDEAFEKYASDLLKEAYEEDPTIWYPVYYEGEHYGFPTVFSGDHSNSVVYVRTDWLEAVGLDVPETLEELEEVMEAFVNDDPNESGENDTYGAAIAFEEHPVEGTANSAFVFGAFGAMPHTWYERDGELVYGSVQPEIEDALARLKEWREKGYIHPELALHNGQDATELFQAERAGVIMAPVWYSTIIERQMLPENPDIDWVPVPLPTGPDGDAGHRASSNSSGMLLFNKDFEHMDAFFLYANTLMEYNNPDSETFANGYHEGYDYAIKDGEAVYGEDIEGGQITSHHYFLGSFDRLQAPYGSTEVLKGLYEGNEPESAFEKYSSAFDERYFHAAAITVDEAENAYIDESVGHLTETMESRWERLTRLEAETFANIVYGEMELDEFDDFIEEWHSAGGEQIVQEMNEWHQEVTSTEIGD